MYDNLWQFVTISAIYGSVCHFFTSLTTFDSYWQFWHLFPFCQYSILANFYYFSEKSYCTFFWETWTLPNIKEILQHDFSVGRGGDDGAGGVGDGGAQAEANNLAVIGPVQMYGRNGQRDSVAQQKQKEKRARCRRNKNLRKAEEKSSANLTAGLKGLNVQVVVRGNVVATP